jgi:hypothetical protein
MTTALASFPPDMARAVWDGDVDWLNENLPLSVLLRRAHVRPWVSGVGVGRVSRVQRQRAHDARGRAIVAGALRDLPRDDGEAVLRVRRGDRSIMNAASFVDQSAVFLHDHPEGARAVDVARAIGQDPSNVSATLRHAHRRGLVERRDGLWFTAGPVTRECAPGRPLILPGGLPYTTHEARRKIMGLSKREYSSRIGVDNVTYIRNTTRTYGVRLDGETLESVVASVDRLVAEAVIGDEHRISAYVLLVGANLAGCNAEKIAEITGLPMDDVRPRVERLVASRVWVDGVYECEATADADIRAQATEFVLHCLCAEGLIASVPDVPPSSEDAVMAPEEERA